MLWPFRFSALNISNAGDIHDSPLLLHDNSDRLFIAFIAFTETGVRNIRVDVFFFAFLQIGAAVVVCISTQFFPSKVIITLANGLHILCGMNLHLA